MINFGDRIKAVRIELGLSQTALVSEVGVGFDQPRLSRIEKGTLKASVDVIERFAKIFGRTGRELVAGTDREGYYIAEGMSPDERAVERQTVERDAAALAELRALQIMLLWTYYGLVFDLFDAVYGGELVAPQVCAEQAYVEVRTQCKFFAKLVDGFLPGTSEQLHYPDHIEPRDDMDLVYDEWRFGERGLVKASLDRLFELTVEHRHFIKSTNVEDLRKQLKIDEGRQAIANLQQQREELNASVLKRFNALCRDNARS